LTIRLERLQSGNQPHLLVLTTDPSSFLFLDPKISWHSSLEVVDWTVFLSQNVGPSVASSPWHRAVTFGKTTLSRMTLGSMAPFGRIQFYSEVLSEGATTLWGQFYWHFWCQYRAGFAQKIFDAFMATFCGKIGPKYGALRKGYLSKHAVKFQCKCWWSRTAIFAPFT